MSINKIDLKPKQLWEFRDFPRGGLLENGLVLNETAFLIYRLCNGKNKISYIIDYLSNQYKQNNSIIKKDVLRCINYLYGEKAIKFNEIISNANNFVNNIWYLANFPGIKAETPITKIAIWATIVGK